MFQNKNRQKTFYTIFLLGLFFLSFIRVNAQTYSECYISCINEGKDKSTCEDKCKFLDTTTTSTTEGYKYYQEHGALDPATGQMRYADTGTTTATSSTSKAFKYTLLESFPGFFTANTQMTDFQALVLAIYKFGIWTVGIAGMFMMTIGGIMYMTSAGNKSTSGSAKDIIWDAIYGIIAALAAYLVLYVINPDLTKININFTKVTVGSPLGLGGGGGNCEPVTGAGKFGTVEQLTSSFGANAIKASSIAKIESGGDPNLLSKVDVCQDNSPFSVGLFQINMIDSAPSICNSNGDIFSTGTSKGTCIERNSSQICVKWSCQVKDRAKYDACLARLKDPAINTNIAKAMSNSGSSWSRWGANSICKF